MNDAHDNAEADKDKLLYIQQNHLDKPIRLNQCHFCDEELRDGAGGSKGDGLFLEEVGEFWSRTLQKSVLGHPDCTPHGIDAIQEGTDPEWSMA